MTIPEVIQRYSTVYNKTVAKGRRNKIIFILLLIPATLYAYSEFLHRRKFRWLRKELSDVESIYVYVALGLLCLTLALLLKSSSFISRKQSRCLDLSFKHDLSECIRQNIPEITEYLHIRKIDPLTFKASGLFNQKYSDYKGDDMLKGVYRNVKFELCELHVFNVFKPIFSGFFVKCKLGCDALTQAEKQIGSSIVSLKRKYNVTVNLSEVQGNIYIAIGVDGQLLENNSRKSIENVERDIALIKDIVGLVKVVVDANSKLAV